HAARARRDRASAARRRARALSGGDGPSACGAVVVRRGGRAADGDGIREICFRQASHGAKNSALTVKGRASSSNRVALWLRAQPASKISPPPSPLVRSPVGQ